MEMMTMMMELDKLPDPFCVCFQDVYEMPEVEFFGGSTSSIEYSTPPIFHNPHLTPSSLSPTIGGGPQQSRSSSFLKTNSVEAMREMIFRIAAMQPIQIDPESVKPPKRKNVKVSKDPQSVAARHRRERISERIRILQRLVPGGTKMDTASMLDEAVHYMKFLKKQVQSLERAAGNVPTMGVTGYPTAMNCSHPAVQTVGSMQILR